jgi:single-strand DNA-binding protein
VFGLTHGPGERLIVGPKTLQNNFFSSLKLQTMLVIGRITKDAVAKQLKDERQVVEFTIAINDWYKPRGGEKPVKQTTFITCSYWINPGIVERLKKGTLVELFGRAGVNVYKDMDGEAKGALTFHVNNVKIHHTVKQETPATNAAAETPQVHVDDLPF